MCKYTIIIIMMSCRQPGYPGPSLATSPYRSSPLVGLQGYIPYPHIVAECMFKLVALLLPRRGQHRVTSCHIVSHRVSGIFTRTMHQSTTPSLSETIWPRWASKQFLNLPIVQTLLPVTFGYTLSSEAVVMRQLMRLKRLWRRSLTRSHKRTCMGPSGSCWNGTISAL